MAAGTRRWRPFRLNWLTLCRPSEAEEARWAEFELGVAKRKLGAALRKLPKLSDRKPSKWAPIRLATPKEAS